MTWKEQAEEIALRRKLLQQQGGPEALARHRDRGKLPLRERIDALLDPGSFCEHGRLAGAVDKDDQGAVTGATPANFLLGFGEIDRRLVVVGGEDFTLKGGSPNASGLRKSLYAEPLALQYRVPLLRLHEGGGGSVSGSSGHGATAGESVAATSRFASVARTLREVPVISAALGPVAGLPAARLVASHFRVMTEATAQVLIAGPAVVERAFGRHWSKEELGGHQVHLSSGVVDNLARDEQDAFAQMRTFLSYLPGNVSELPPVRRCDDRADRCDEALLAMIPRDRRAAYDMRELLQRVLDRDSFFEYSAGWGRGIITGLARLMGRPVGVLANDCTYYAGAMSAQGAQKTARFIRFCDCFHLPVLSFVDEPGFLIGMEAERGGTIFYGADAVLAAAESRVPWASVIVRKSFGVAQAAHYGPGSYVLSWPSAETGPLPLEGGVAVAYGREIASAPDPEARRRELEEQLAARLDPFARAENFSVHDLIDPRETRPLLCQWMRWITPSLETLLQPGRGTVVD